jgi:enterochelin esterase-like enzyme
MKSKLIALYESKASENISFEIELAKQYPIIEDIPDDTQNKLVTVVYCGDQSSYAPGIYSPLLDLFPKTMARLGNTNYFYYTLVAPDSIRVSYAFLPNILSNYINIQSDEERTKKFTDMLSALIPDRYNSNKIILKTGEPRITITTSILEMSSAPSKYWSQKKLSVPSGELENRNIDSHILQAQRDYWVYLPPVYDKRHSYPLLIVFDGQLYSDSGIPLPTIVDNLIYEKKILPIIIVFIDSVGFHRRRIDLKCSENFLNFITEELLPEINLKYSVSNDRLNKILMGASLGGLFSLYASLQRPDLFGKVLSQSGTGNTISQLINKDQTYPLKIYLDVGSLEVAEIATTQECRDLLMSAGHEVIYHVFPGAHDLVCWETSIPNALTKLLGRE